MLGGLITITGGVLASSGFIISRKPDAKQLIDKIVPYTGWIGVVLFCWGVWETISVVTGLGLLASHPLRWVFWLCVAAADLIVGFMLGFSLISKYALSKNEAALAKGQQMREKLMKIQAPLGLFAIVMGVLYLVWLYVL
jgi:hypothetical protein